MKVRLFGIFGKVFFYTCLILAVVTAVFAVLFSSQIKNTATLTQQQQLGEAFQPLLRVVGGKTDAEIVSAAELFHTQNNSYDFCVESADGSVLYQTENFTRPDNSAGLLNSNNSISSGDPTMGRFIMTANGGDGKSLFLALTFEDKKLYVSGQSLTSTVYGEIWREAALGFALILAISLATAAIFARGIAKPIRVLAHNSRKMAKLEDAPPFPARNDEIGELAKDVYAMRDGLKNAIESLEEEIEREREMEENQRYFFSAASHELKTPIAAATAILEGMTEGVIDTEEYPEYARRALRLMREQGALVTEILDVVKMSDRMAKPVFESVNVGGLIGNVLKPLEPFFEAKSQTLNVSIGVEIICRTDPRLLTKALINIFQNAVQNSSVGAEIRVAADIRGDSVKLTIENGGARISEENLPKLFAPFFVEDESRSKRGGRNGLGLTIVKKILDLLEVPFALENTAFGVMFTLTLSCS